MVDVIRRSLAEIRERAHAELLLNDTITVYTCIDDYEWRRQGNSFAKLRAESQRLSESFAGLGESFARFGDQIRASMEGLA